MREPEHLTVESITAEVRRSNPKLSLVSTKLLELIVGLILRLALEYFIINRDLILEEVVAQLKKRGYGSFKIWAIKWAINTAIDTLIPWLEESKAETIRLGEPAFCLPELY